MRNIFSNWRPTQDATLKTAIKGRLFFNKRQYCSGMNISNRRSTLRRGFDEESHNTFPVLPIGTLEYRSWWDQILFSICLQLAAGRAATIAGI